MIEFGVLLARHLHENAVDALLLDGRLARADLVDAPAHDLDRLLHRPAAQIDHRLLAEGDRDPAVAAVLDLDLARHRVGVQVVQQLDGPSGERGIGQRQYHGIALDAEPAIADPLRPQRGARVVEQAVQALGDHRIEIDLEQQMGAALEVEPEIDLLVRQPVRHALHLGAREEIREG